MEKVYILIFFAFVILLLISLIPDFYIIYRLHKKHEKMDALAQEIHTAKEKSVENNQEILGLQKIIEYISGDK